MSCGNTHSSRITCLKAFSDMLDVSVFVVSCNPNSLVRFALKVNFVASFLH